MRRFILIVLILGSTLISGCSNKNEIDEITFVTIIGINKTKDSGIELNALCAVPRNFSSIGSNGGGKGEPNYIISEQGNSISNILEKIKLKEGKELFFGQNKIILFSDELGNDNINKLVQEFLHLSEFQPTNWIGITDGSTTEVLKLKPNSTESISDFLDSAFSGGGTNTMGILPIYLYRFYSLHLENGQTPYAMVLKRINNANFISFDKLALFRDNKIVGSIGSNEISFLQMLLGKKLKRVVFEVKKNTYSVTNYKKSISFSGDSLQIKLNLDMAIEGKSTKLTKNSIFSIENELEKKFEERLNSLLIKFKDLRVDPIGLGKYYMFNNSKELTEKQWLEHNFQNIKTDIQVNVSIKKIGKML
ncbi:Ger(x)C family spore germination protein [Cytobacillus firmus]|uniref:Ger(x)C family spore germination protein n=1 Tax=Cytobacillus firmus TaxID=1399 RepID=UPI0018CDE70A|nr:Ger(x)C family spore germination protein [Cytobacillus firmus]MBG9587269.1 hypothetical protein [Cytobacillus firmus]